MRFSLLAALALIVPAFAAVTPALKTVTKASGEKKAGSYIVKFKEGTVRAAVYEGATHVYDPSFLNGFAANLDTAALNTFRADPDVESIEEDGIVSIFANVTQTNAPWGLSRIAQDAKLTGTSTTALTYSYTYDDAAAGNGVDIFIIDTGVLTAHTQFEGRARWGATFGGYADADGHGHGTHVAGTAAGVQFGVAKKASIIAVKVLSDAGSGAVSDIVAGLSFVRDQAAASGRPSIASLSLGGGASTALDSAVAALTAAGVHVVVAAGNSNVDAANTSPARAPSAITVGAITIADARSSFSNFGAVVDIFAPGTSITSAWIGSTTATNNISGTSQATPHVSGVAAYIISLLGNRSPAELSALLKQLSVKGALTGVPTGTLNDLLNTN
ncbi:serine protease [Mycena crocata]|nr:serine protease [Mycena crocata]